MKTLKPISVIFLIICVAVSVNCKPKTPKTPKSPESPQTHIVTLYVNTKDIVHPNIDQFANFGQDAGISNKEFTILVKKGDIVLWRGVSTSSPKDTVNIKAINHEGGVNVFGRNVIRGNGDTPEVVVGLVINGEPGDEEKYKLSFKVSVNGANKNGTFHIDPKIMVNN